jgi:hypothetical protein
MVSAILVLACLVLIGMQAWSPLLYSPRSDARAEDHTNPAALDRVTGDRAAQVLPLVSDLLNSPGSLVLNIKGRDFEYAARDLQEYREISRNLDSLIINLEMTESELDEFRRANQQNLQILTELFNGTERWEELQTLEIRYRDTGDSQMLTSITYEGEALRRRIQDLYRDYLDQDQVMLETADKFALDTKDYRQSVTDFREIVQQVDQNQEERMDALQVPAPPGERPYKLTLLIENGRVSYRENVAMQGLLWVHEKGRADEVDLFIDSHKVGTIVTGPDGSFRYDHLVERDRAGTHTVFAVYSGSVFSEIRTFLVETESTSLDLEFPSLQGGHALFTGLLRAGTTPVQNAHIEILAEGKRAATTFTGTDGHFSVELKLSPGTHRAKALFSGETYPLAPSESVTYEISIPDPSLQLQSETGLLANPLHAGILAVSVCASCLIAFFYLRRRRPGYIPPAPVFHLPGGGAEEGAGEKEEGGSAADLVPSLGDLPIPDSGEAGDADTRGELYPLFSTLRMAVSRHLAFFHPLSLTPRELCTMCRGLPIRSAVCRFTEGYEKARYAGGAVSEGDRELMVQSYSSAIENLEGRDH